MQGAIVFGCGVVTCLLPEPFSKGLFGFRHGKGIGVDHDGCVLPGGHFVDEQVIIPAGKMVDGREAFVAEEDIFLVGEITSYTHIGDACQCVGEILKGGMESVEADDLVEKAGGLFIGAVSKDYFDAVVITVLHFLHPEFAGRHTVGVREQNDLVPGFLDTHAEGVFFTGDTDGLLFEIDDMQTFEGLFKFIQQEAGVVLAVVIDDDNLMRAGISLDEGAGEMRHKFGGFIACTDDDADGMLL